MTACAKGSAKGPAHHTDALPGFHGENVGWARMAFDDLRLDDGFHVQLFPVGGQLGDERVEINRVIENFSSRLGSLFRNSCRNNDRLAVVLS